VTGTSGQSRASQNGGPAASTDTSPPDGPETSAPADSPAASTDTSPPDGPETSAPVGAETDEA
jgi:hypothetical protein